MSFPSKKKTKHKNQTYTHSIGQFVSNIPAIRKHPVPAPAPAPQVEPGDDVNTEQQPLGEQQLPRAPLPRPQHPKIPNQLAGLPAQRGRPRPQGRLPRQVRGARLGQRPRRPQARRQDHQDQRQTNRRHELRPLLPRDRRRPAAAAAEQHDPPDGDAALDQGGKRSHRPPHHQQLRAEEQVRSERRVGLVAPARRGLRARIGHLGHLLRRHQLDERVGQQSGQCCSRHLAW